MPAIAALSIVVGETGAVGNAEANGDTRSLNIYHTHSKETAVITFKRNGVFDRDGLEKLNWLLRDWRFDEPTSMDPRLFDIVWEVYREVGSQEPIHVVSAYRAPETNAMLRRRSRAVAKHSQHMLGKAMDFYLPDASMAKVREVGLRLQRGGVGYYPNAYNPFVHLDAGSVRHWPRMSRDQLARLFPDGKTVHIPIDGKPMPGYEEAAAEVVANGGTVFAYAGNADGEEGSTRVVTARKGKSFFAALFGLGGEDEDEETAQPVRGRGRGPSRPSTQVAAYAPATAEDDRYVAVNFGRTDREPARPAPLFGRRQPDAPPAPAPVQVASLGPMGPAGAAVIEPPPAPAPVAPPAPRSADVPLPASRPVALAALEAPAASAPGQPQMVWQAGPTGAPSAVEPRIVNLPLPLARPADLGPATAPVYANVPLPPARPVALASLEPMLPATLPVGMPNTTRAAAEAHAHGAASARSPEPSRAEAPADEPENTAALDRDGLQALFASSSLGGKHPAAPRPASVSTAKAKIAPKEIPGAAAKPVTTVAMRFERGPGELSADRFSGPAVKAVPLARFSPAH
ncbi:peptidase domain containing protein [Alsobacter soli]|uniref:Murein endopeptidase K n=1 Tax=Alsobacter soli TaxID=2109933 RepID=A0A2T1HZY6_9HYPH|nr:DUF882 domain-containing protein [Alsobacter soli]PSC07019.1 peptidase domain containing protein [Alsobacter soli]